MSDHHIKASVDRQLVTSQRRTRDLEDGQKSRFEPTPVAGLLSPTSTTVAGGGPTGTGAERINLLRQIGRRPASQPDLPTPVVTRPSIHNLYPPVRPAVVRRSMGMEVETHRGVQDSADNKVAGDKTVLTHQFFELVSDSSTARVDDVKIKYSNLEFVMKHFDQLAGSEADAISELNKRLEAMRALRDKLYANVGTVAGVAGGVTPHNRLPALGEMYQAVADDGGGGTESFKISARPGAKADDELLYVHYTVGFPPKDWRRMLANATAASRPDSKKNRGCKLALDGLDVAGTIVTKIPHPDVTGDVLEEVQGQLALTYMQMRVFIDRTVDQQAKKPKSDLKRLQKDAERIKDLFLRLDKRHADPDKKEKRKNKLNEEMAENLWKQAVCEAKLKRVGKSVPFGKGLPKNKVVALPRASLAEGFSMLNGHGKEYLKANSEAILNEFTEHLEKATGVDFTDDYELESGDRTIGAASLVDYVRAGLGSKTSISQQVVFGGMNEVGIDRTDPGRHLLPFEFRSLFAARVTWGDLKDDAARVLKWSRDPHGTELARP